jgi:hypothetical protein
MWEDNITMNLLEVGWGHMDWIKLVYDRVRWCVVCCEGGDEPCISINWEEFVY